MVPLTPSVMLGDLDAFGADRFLRLKLRPDADVGRGVFKRADRQSFGLPRQGRGERGGAGGAQQAGKKQTSIHGAFLS
jgi:hypothetical protein